MNNVRSIAKSDSANEIENTAYCNISRSRVIWNDLRIFQNYRIFRFRIVINTMKNAESLKIRQARQF